MKPMIVTPRIAALYELQAELTEPKLKVLGMGWTTFQLLSTVQSAGEDASQAEVARRLGVTPATLSESVSAHVAKGLLVRVSSQADRRLKVLTLTKKSEALMAKVMVVLQDVEAQMLHGLGSGTVDSGTKLLDKCIANLEKAVGNQ